MLATVWNGIGWVIASKVDMHVSYKVIEFEWLEVDFRKIYWSEKVKNLVTIV